MFSQIKQAWRRRLFVPGLASLATNPYHLVRAPLYRSFAAHAPGMKGRVLDVGCGSKPYAALFSNTTSYEGLDIDQPRTRECGIADHFYGGGDFPFPDASFDNIVCSQVLEHVFEPDRFCAELARVLVPGGKLLLTVPFVWEEHEQPWDSRRYTSFGLRDLMERNGFDVLVQEKFVTGFAAIVQLVQARHHKICHAVFRKWPRVFRLLLNVSYAPLNLVGIFLQFLPTSDSDLYLDNFILLERKRGDS